MSQVLSPFLYNIPLSQKDAASGVPSLDAGTKVPETQIPVLTSAKIPALSYAKITRGNFSGNGEANRAIAHGLGKAPETVQVIIYEDNKFLVLIADTFFEPHTATRTLVTGWDATNFYVAATHNANGKTLYWTAIG